MLSECCGRHVLGEYCERHGRMTCAVQRSGKALRTTRRGGALHRLVSWAVLGQLERSSSAHASLCCVASDASARRGLDAPLSCRARSRCCTLEVDSWEDMQTAVVVPQDSCSAARAVMISCVSESETNSRCSDGNAMSKTNEMSNSCCAHSQLDEGTASPTPAGGCTNNVTPVSRDRI